MQRLRAMWLNLIRVRYLASRLLGNDLGERVFGIDEKPLHFNEGGSTCVGTLEIAGVKSVKLKENHAATRERVSLITSVTSCPHMAASASRMPVELLCKAKSRRRTAGLKRPLGLRVSLQWAEKGSYRGGEHGADPREMVGALVGASSGRSRLADLDARRGQESSRNRTR